MYQLSTCFQFKTSYRKLLLGATHKSRNGNCQFLDQTSLLALSTTKKSTNFICELFELNEEDGWTELWLENLENNEYKHNILTYICGFIQKKILDKEQCVNCFFQFKNFKVLETSSFLELKNKGGLCRPNEQLTNVVKICRFPT